MSEQLPTLLSFDFVTHQSNFHKPLAAWHLAMQQQRRRLQQQHGAAGCGSAHDDMACR